ncbi:uncharacterized protein EI90DRAFT_3065741 [Cantharellus anzutake]|uniref:uncharacterized protein n=1 Tax=Cantharellus anzutake TaxID=1750568 RepID=UPI001908B911|nr:uncharacterized protein EI90DRAFT_3065741 [Cantharellus anzutake]KAF8328150.1 hypothetical protein EI90DRAFT_3065741 [Cantharellus anzutake]
MLFSVLLVINSLPCIFGAAVVPPWFRWLGGALPSCKLKGVKMPNQTSAFPKTSQKSDPEAVMLGAGVQNYTCTNGKYTSMGAVATLFDISCIIRDQNSRSLSSFAKGLVSGPVLESSWVQGFAAGHHYFVNINGALLPRFDLSKSKTVRNDEYIIARKLANIPSPDGASNVDWLQLGGTGTGSYANFVYRVKTAGGQPPSSVSEKPVFQTCSDR